MGSAKRKNGVESHIATKRAKFADNAQPKKSPKLTTPGKENDTTTRKTESSQAKSITKHLLPRLKEDEPLFPRGGGSVLTPLEHKQIQIQARNDVLFEQESSQAAGAEKPLKKKKRKADLKSKPALLKKADDEDGVKIESLNYSRLVKGSVVLGQVCAITSFEVQLALPNNLVGHVPLTSISDAVTKRVENAATALADEDDESDADDGVDDIDLDSMFEKGQYLRAYVSSTVDESSSLSGKSRKRIELSLKPEQANAGMTKEDFVPHGTAMACVASVEDHGFVMDLGVTDVRGFLPRKEAGAEATERMQPGVVMLCVVTGTSANGQVAQLSRLHEKLGDNKKAPSGATTIHTYLPGTLADVLVSEVTDRGIAGKVMGHLDVTADLVHSGAGPLGIDLAARYKVGSHVKARIICTFPAVDKPKFGASLLPHITSLQTQAAANAEAEIRPLDFLPSSSLVENCIVKGVQPGIGLFVDVGVKGVPGFVHISRVKDGKVDALYEHSGPFKLDSVHPGRVLGYNPVDGLFQVSFEQHVLDQPYLHIEDVPVGEKVQGVIERLLVGEEGVSGLIVEIAEGISGLVTQVHMADIRLQHPEKMFNVGKKVSARVLFTDPARHQLRLTLKKTLVNSDAPPVKSFDDVSVGLQALGTIVKVLQSGAVVQFYGSVRGFLPVSEMSEAYISDPREHFRIGQVVSVHVVEFDREASRLLVSCKDPSAFGLEKQVALKKLKIGDIVSGAITQTTEADVLVQLSDSSLNAILPIGHLTDKSAKKTQSALQKLRVGQVLKELVVLEKNEGRRTIIVSQKPSLIDASRAGKLLTDIEHAHVGDVVAGFVQNITPTAVFVKFGGQRTALLPKSKMPKAAQQETDFGMHKFQSVLAKITAVDLENGRMVVAMPEIDGEPRKAPKQDDPKVSVHDISVGEMVKARVVSIKDTQLNVELEDKSQGRVDVSHVFDTWDEIQDPKQPLQQFHTGQRIRAKVLGVRDAKNHKFLPISHRSTHSVLELSIRPSHVRDESPTDSLAFEDLKVGDKFVGFVNNVGQSCLWISLSPNVRGRVAALETTNDYSWVKDLAGHFPIGSALRVGVLAIDADNRRLDLSARSEEDVPRLDWDNIKPNMVVPGHVVKANDHYVMVKLSEALSGVIRLVDLCDDYDLANPLKYSKNDIGHFAVSAVDKPNKRLRLSARPSRVLDSSLPVKDAEITAVSQIKSGQLIRGFVKNVSDKGLFVSLGGDIDAMVKISDLSDKFLKDWKEHFQVDQLVKGRVKGIDLASGQVALSLKESVINENYVPLTTLDDLKEGQVITGKVRKAMDFGVFITVDGSANVSGLCHRSEMADSPVADATKLYNEGDAVKAVVLKIEKDKKRVNFGLKPSYFLERDGDDEDMDVDEDDDEMEDDGGVLLDRTVADGDEEMQDALGAVHISGTDNRDAESEVDGQSDDGVALEDTMPGLDAGGFDWSANALDVMDKGGSGALSASGDARPRAAAGNNGRRAPHIQIDRTGSLDAHGPQTASDYERLLLGQPDSSRLWIAYMAFQMQVAELARARDVAERALRTIGIAEEADKLNVWTAYLNLEVVYGGEEDKVQDVFARACAVCDAREVHERLASIYIQSGKHAAADALFQAMLKKFGARSPDVWFNYGHFLHATRGTPDRARALLQRANQALPSHAILPLTVRFAALEFRSPNGAPELGRTLFEGLMATWPRKLHLWDQLVDLEASVYGAARAKDDGGEGGASKTGAPEAGQAVADAAAVRDVFERATHVAKLKPRWARNWFKKWAQWEETNGDAKSRERVSVRAREWAAAAEARKRKREEEGEEEGEGEDDGDE